MSKLCSKKSRLCIFAALLLNIFLAKLYLKCDSCVNGLKTRSSASFNHYERIHFSKEDVTSQRNSNFIPSPTLFSLLNHSIPSNEFRITQNRSRNSNSSIVQNPFSRSNPVTPRDFLCSKLQKSSFISFYESHLLGTLEFIHPLEIDQKQSHGMYSSNKDIDFSHNSSPVSFSSQTMAMERVCIRKMRPYSQSFDPSKDFHSRKFLYIVRLSEQLTKAMRHFSEAIALAKRFNRTLILPWVGRSRIGVSQNLNFCSYFNEVVLGEYVEWVSEYYFLEKACLLNHSLSSFFICLRTPDSPLSCHSGDLKMKTISQIIQSSIPKKNSENFATVKKFSSVDHSQNRISYLMNTNRMADIVFYSKVSYPSSLPFTSYALSHIQFSPTLLQEASELMQDHLNPSFIAIHLRFEYVVSYRSLGSNKRMRLRLFDCANDLIKRVNRLRRRNKIENVFVASDISDPSVEQNNENQTSVFETNAKMNANDSSTNPTTSVSDSTDSLAKELGLDLTSKPLLHSQNSDTWSKFEGMASANYSMRAYKRIKMLLKAFTLVDMKPALRHSDRGVQSILDKLICANATVFVAGHRACGGGGNFQSQILKLRRENGRSLFFKFRSKY